MSIDKLKKAIDQSGAQGIWVVHAFQKNLSGASRQPNLRSI